MTLCNVSKRKKGLTDKRDYDPFIMLDYYLFFQLIGWFFFGSALILKGAILNHYLGGEGRSFSDANSGFFLSSPLFKVKLMKCYEEKYLITPPQDFELSFPVEDSLLECYKERDSCVNNDFPEEVKS